MKTHAPPSPMNLRMFCVIRRLGCIKMSGSLHRLLENSSAYLKELDIYRFICLVKLSKFL